MNNTVTVENIAARMGSAKTKRDIQIISPHEFKALCTARPVERITYDSTEYNAPFVNPCFLLQFDHVEIIPARAERPAACILSKGDSKMIFNRLYKVAVDDSAQSWTVATLYCTATGHHKILIDWTPEKGGTA